MLFSGHNGRSRTSRQTLIALTLRLLRDRRGVSVVLIAIAFPALIGVTALGVEIGFWYALKRQDQTAADAAALSGAYERAAGQLYSDICALAQRDAAANGFPFQSYTCPNTSPGCTSPSSGQMCANNPPVSGSSAGDDKAVEVILIVTLHRSRSEGEPTTSLMLRGFRR
jgi:hypothetical protein